MSGCLVAQNREIKFVFRVINVTGDRLLELSAESEAARNAWVETIQVIKSHDH